MDWLPLYDKLIVRRDAPEEKLSKEADIVVAEAHKKKQNHGVVVAAGEGRICPDGQLLQLTVRVGDKVLFGQHTGIDMEEDENIVMMREDEVLAYVPEGVR